MNRALPCLFAFLALSTSPVFAQQSTSLQKDRVTLRPELRNSTTTLRGHVPAWAVSANDRGAIAGNTPLRLTFVLSRAPEVQASFEQLLADQQDPGSPNYHRWLTPQEVGERFGPTQHDIEALSDWLGSQGFAGVEVAPSGVFVSATATADTAAHTLATSFHRFEVNGETRISAVTDPAIPSALAAVVGSIDGLADVAIHPMVHTQVSQTGSGTEVAPRYTGSGNTHYVTPGDFATIFDLKPVYNAGYTGTGQRVAVIGRSRVASSDITSFETTTGLASNLPNTIIPANGVDPGITGNGDQGEATLDLERLIATAPGVQADLVVSGSAGGSSGLYVAAQYEVQTLLDPVMNISFGACEAFAGASGVNLWDTLFAQAASEGISVFVSSADSGAAACDTQFGQTQPYQFRSINYICASSYVTCVGGTEFADTSNSSLYWMSTNGANFVSALGYIPEGAWNEPTNSTGAYVAASGGGGASVYIPKPVWQTGAGVPTDGARDVPDVSFPSAGHDAYFGCYAAEGGDCGAGKFMYFFGTSGAAPAMAGVAALLNQKTGSSQGNLNPLLYKVAATTPNAFHDATIASSGVSNCSVNIASMCNNSTPGPNSSSGGIAGYLLTTGYDQATGLGSLDVANFLNAAATVGKSSLAATTLSITSSASTIADTQTVVFTATLTSKTVGTPSGTVQFYANANPVGAAVAVVSGKAVTAPLPFAAAGSYLITAAYSGDATFASTVAPGIPLTVTGINSLTKVTASSTSIPVGTTATFTATVTPSSGTVVPTGTVRFSIPGSTNDVFVAIVPLSGGVATTPAIKFSYAGNYTLVAEYVGDSVYSPSNSVAMPITVQKLVSTNQLFAPTGSIGIGGSKGYTASIGVPPFSTVGAPTGTVQLYVNGVVSGAPTSLVAFAPPSTGALAAAFTSVGTYTITEVYSGDANYLASTSSPVSLTVISTPASYTLAPTYPTMTVTGPGNSSTNSIGITASLGFAGPITLSCAVTYNGATSGGVAPVCTLLTPNPETMTVNTTGIIAAVQVTTTAPRIAGGSSLSASGAQRSFGWNGSRTTALCALLLCIAPLRRRVWRSLALLLLMATGFGALCGCGGSGGGSGGGSPGTTPGSYTVTVTASTTVSGIAVPAPVTIALTVNQALTP